MKRFNNPIGKSRKMVLFNNNLDCLNQDRNSYCFESIG